MNSNEKLEVAMYTLGSIHIDEEGEFHVQWLGTHSGKTGVEFGVGRQQSSDPAFVFKCVAKNMARCKDEYLKLIQEAQNERARETEARPESEEISDNAGSV